MKRGSGIGRPPSGKGWDGRGRGRFDAAGAWSRAAGGGPHRRGTTSDGSRGTSDDFRARRLA
jgi:hypothetical protein